MKQIKGKPSRWQWIMSLGLIVAGLFLALPVFPEEIRDNIPHLLVVPGFVVLLFLWRRKEKYDDLPLEEQLKQAYGEATIEDRYFTKDDVCGLPAYQYCYDLDLDGSSMSQIIICINADQTYTFTFTASDDETLALFEDTVKTINLTLE